jgi:hypothetical protein
MPYEYYKGRSYWLNVRRQDELILSYEPTSKAAAKELFDRMLAGLADTPPTLRMVPVCAYILATEAASETPPCPDDPFSEQNFSHQHGYTRLRHIWRRAGRPSRPTCSCCGQRWRADLWPEVYIRLVLGEKDAHGQVFSRSDMRPLAFEVICQWCAFGGFAMDTDRMIALLKDRVFGVDILISRQVDISTFALGLDGRIPTLADLRDRLWLHNLRVALGRVLGVRN